MIDESKNVSRREFLKIAGIAGATIGVGAGMGGLLAACGEEETTTTTAAATTTTAAAATTTTAAASTTTVTAAAVGRELKVGFVTPTTGQLAAFGVPDQYCLERATEAVADGMVCADGQKHPIKFITKDSQSDANRAAQVAGDLINNDKVDLILVRLHRDVVNPVADQCEAGGVPCLSTDVPWQNFIYGRGGDPTNQYKWTYNFFWGLEDIIDSFFDVWNTVPTNKKVAVLLSNSAPGNAWLRSLESRHGTQRLHRRLHRSVPCGVGGLYRADIRSSRRTATRSRWVCSSRPTSPTSGSSASSRASNPKTGAWSMCLEFPQAAEALGDLCINLASESMWTPGLPVHLTSSQ